MEQILAPYREETLYLNGDDADTREMLTNLNATQQFKWNPQKNVRLSKTFSNAYPNHDFKVITPENFHEFVISY